ncbi:hypothetical protein APA_3811 [Pseudanabaena sp. lw0831]|nr:hypothetical protein APA_3811 [Pseudanabaena sp. lw0831]
MIRLKPNFFCKLAITLTIHLNKGDRYYCESRFLGDLIATMSS